MRDVDRAVSFYCDAVGLAVHCELQDGGTRMGWGAGHHVLDILPGDGGLEHFGFEVLDPRQLDAVRKRLLGAGAQLRALPAGLGVDGFAFDDADGNEVHMHGRVERGGEHAADPGRRPIRYQHLTLSTADLPRLRDFYHEVVGFRLSDQLGDEFAWLRSDREHHSLAMTETGHTGQLDHYSFDVSGWEDFKTWCDGLTARQIPVAWGPGRHGPGDNLFIMFDDPAGYHIELSAEMERFHDDRAEYAPRRWVAEPRAINLWGGQLPSWRTAGADR